MKAIEAAAKFAECSISRQGKFMQMTPEEIDYIWKSTMGSGRGAVLVKKYETFLKAYLTALAEDDAAVERVARAMLADELTVRPTLAFDPAWQQECDIWLSNARAAIRAMGGK